MSAAECYAAGHPPLSISISHPLGQQQQSLPLWHLVLSPFVWLTEFCTRSQSRSSTGCQGHVFAHREYRDCVSNASLYQITSATCSVCGILSADNTRSSAIAEGPCDASCQLKCCQLPRNSAETTCTRSPEQVEVMKLEG